MIRFCGAPEREKLATTDQMMKVFEAAVGIITKGRIFMKESRRKREGGTRFQALRYLLSNYQKVGIKHKCIIMLTINTIMSALPASLFC